MIKVEEIWDEDFLTAEELNERYAWCLKEEDKRIVEYER